MVSSKHACEPPWSLKDYTLNRLSILASAHRSAHAK